MLPALQLEPLSARPRTESAVRPPQGPSGSATFWEVALLARRSCQMQRELDLS